MADILERKCNGKVVFVVSRSFHASQECQFLVQFAKTLDPYAVHQKLIPLIIDRDVQIPRVLEGLSGIYYNQALRENWLWKKLWEAVHHHGGSRSSPAACSPASLFSFK
ncbi:myeloid differentiation primary response protein MyD88-like [Pomacea canaliculata]|uniref:myeloid differentiation primary response protein MyD88-like n=1 Tax=Pomacea canaliculata TaxID=400727 RepID=UPI000D7318EF|nr:myeloid differentiation primary response protein MyD88-like [Pomacea canaliculata]